MEIIPDFCKLAAAISLEQIIQSDIQGGAVPVLFVKGVSPVACDDQVFVDNQPDAGACGLMNAFGQVAAQLHIGGSGRKDLP